LKFLFPKIGKCFLKKKEYCGKIVPFYFYFSHFIHKTMLFHLPLKIEKSTVQPAFVFGVKFCRNVNFFGGEGCNPYKCLDFLFFFGKKSPIKQGF
jgi:hypothetical protein